MRARQLFEDPGVQIVRGLNAGDMVHAKRLVEENFCQYEAEAWAWTVEQSNPGVSFKAVNESGIVGVYMLGKRQLMPEFEGMRGVEGVALAVDERYRGRGVGARLIEAPKSLGVDYVWGMQLKALGNIQHWLKRRHIVREDDELYVTAEVYSGRARQLRFNALDPVPSASEV